MQELRCVDLSKEERCPMKIEGVPEGYELLRVGKPEAGDLYIATDGSIQQCGSPIASEGWAIVRKIEKPKRYRPFSCAEEFKPFASHWFFSKEEEVFFRVQGFSDEGVFWSRTQAYPNKYVDFFSDFTFGDGVPAGVEIGGGE